MAIEKHRRDRELEEAANAVKREASLPDSILLNVHDMHLTLEDEVENPTQRQRAAQVLSTVPGIKSITNRIRLKSSAAAVTGSPDENQSPNSGTLVKRAELDSKGIHLVLPRANRYGRRRKTRG